MKVLATCKKSVAAPSYRHETKSRFCVLLTERDWEVWFEVSRVEAARLVVAHRALCEAGFHPSPEAVICMSRSMLGGPDVAAKLRVLADGWDRTPVPRFDAEEGWLETAEPPFVSALRSYRWLLGDGGDVLQQARCRRRCGS